MNEKEMIEGMLHVMEVQTTINEATRIYVDETNERIDKLWMTVLSLAALAGVMVWTM